MKLEKISGIELAFYKKNNKEAVTTSRVLAIHFGKRHDNLLAKIEKLKKEESGAFAALRIKGSSYIDESGKKSKEFLLNRDAYSFFAMGFTGKNATKFKLDFIQAFNEMESWIKDRLQNSLEYKIMSETLDEVRKLAGKETKTYHYSTEARLVNWAMTGDFKPLDRESLSQLELDLLFDLQKRNTVLIGAGMSYADRKESLKIYVGLKQLPTQEK